jgi:hypothetical protein
MPHFQKHFTVEEANALLPELIGLLQDLKTERDHLVLEWQNAAPVVRASPRNGGGAQASAYVAGLLRLNRLLKGFAERGVLVKDVDMGLVDFPYLMGEEEVLLCWKLGEDRVEYWHDLESGYQGRRPIDELE